MVIEAILLDHGNVLSRNSGPDIPQIIEFFKKRYNLDLKPGEVKRTLEQTISPLQEGNVSAEYFWKVFFEKLNIQLPQEGHFPTKEYESIWPRLGVIYRDLSALNPESISLIYFLKPKVSKIGLLSNSIKPLGEINRFEGIYDYFGKNVFLSYELGFKKPKQEAYQISCSRMGVQPESTLFIDDSMKNVEGARECGLIAIRFDAGVQPYEDLRKELKFLGIF